MMRMFPFLQQRFKFSSLKTGAQVFTVATVGVKGDKWEASGRLIVDCLKLSPSSLLLSWFCQFTSV